MPPLPPSSDDDDAKKLSEQGDRSAEGTAMRIVSEAMPLDAPFPETVEEILERINIKGNNEDEG